MSWMLLIVGFACGWLWRDVSAAEAHRRRTGIE